jgi:hypothetical protein
VNLPVVHKYVCDTQSSNQETSRPLCLEPDGDHDTSTEAEERDQKSEDAKLTLEHESDEEEDQEDSSSQLEATSYGIPQFQFQEDGRWEQLTTFACHSR